VIIVVPDVQQPSDPNAPPQPIFGGGIPPKLQATWASWAGDQWTITDNSSPVLALQGATGLRGADVEHWWSESPMVHGSMWGGLRVAHGEIFMPIRIDGPTLDDFLTTHAAFMRSLDPTRESVLRITLPTGEWREIPCRYVSGMDAAIEPDPLAVRRATYGITWATADPYWQGEPIILDFGYTDPAPLFPGPPFVINRARSLASATYSNPGDVASFPVWRITGPFDSFTVGIAGHVVSMDVAKPADGWVEIDTNPSRLTMLDEDGQDMWLNATDADFVALEPGQDVKLTTTLANAGPGASVTLTFTPRYRSAWA
jgi:hypothetical protein